MPPIPSASDAVRVPRAEAIVALDFPTWATARPLVDRLGAGCRFYKVGLELFTAEGPAVVRELRQRGCDVFLDLKLHDIPNTMRGGARSAAELGVRLLTVHASAGAAGVAAAVEGAGDRCGVLAVTILTSLDAPQLAAAWGRPATAVDVDAEVLRLAGIADAAGAHGVVCSGHEVAAVRRQFAGRLECLVPGIRAAGERSDDQARVATPAAVVGAGARYLILGRMVRDAADPCVALDAVRRVLDDRDAVHPV